MRLYSKDIALVLALLLLITFPSTRAEPTSAAEIFSGAKLPRDLDELPATVELPEAWKSHFLAMNKRTVETLRETGSCLLVSGAGGRLTYGAGEIQVGEEMTVFTDLTRRDCRGSRLAAVVHTHPGSARDGHLLSSTDLSLVINDPSGGLRAGVPSFTSTAAGKSCLMLPTAKTKGTESQARLEAMYTAFLLGKIFERIDAGIPGDGDDRSGIIAMFAERYSAGFYCGDIATRLVRVKSIPPPKATSPLYILAIKGMALMEKRKFPRIQSLIDFPFDTTRTPDLDDYLARISRWNGKTLDAFKMYKEARNSGSAFVAAFELLHIRTGSDISTYGDITIPSRHYTKDPVLLFHCYVKPARCDVTESEMGRADRKETTILKVLASYEVESGEGFWIDLRFDTMKSMEEKLKAGENVRIDADRDGSMRIAECSFQADGCVLNGNGTTTTSEFIYEGKFSDGNMHGPGEVTFKKSGEVWEGLMNQGVFTRGRRIK